MSGLVRYVTEKGGINGMNRLRHRRGRYTSDGVKLCARCDNPISYAGQGYCKEHRKEADRRYRLVQEQRTGAIREETTQRKQKATERIAVKLAKKYGW